MTILKIEGINAIFSTNIRTPFVHNKFYTSSNGYTSLNELAIDNIHYTLTFRTKMG